MDRTLADILNDVRKTAARDEDRQAKLKAWTEHMIQRLQSEAERRVRSEAARAVREAARSVGSPAERWRKPPQPPREQTASPFCTACGHRHAPNAAFCTQCGVKRSR